MVQVEGPLIAGRPLTLTLRGPSADEAGEVNPFADYRLTAVFTDGESRFEVPGYFAADGLAGESGAAAGDCWRVHFVPSQPGRWTYTIRFLAGRDVAVSDDPTAGQAVAPDGVTGVVDVAPVDPADASPWRRGKLQPVGQRYFRFAGSGEYFLKGGADSPENLLGYADFDGTVANMGRGGENVRPLKRYEAHVRDWQPGDPTWRGGRGKGLIGALNYLASKGMNSVYFLTMNVNGDGKDVWPWTSPDVRDRFDCSKLDQWNIVFDHMDTRGLALHVVTQETENDQLLNDGELGRERKLYYRELVARFSHHQAVVWNLGEETTHTTAQLKAFAQYIRALDPYDNPIVLHTYPGEHEKRYAPLLGGTLDGLSLQFDGKYRPIAAQTQRWIERSADAGRQWVVSIDELGPADRGVDPDSRTADGNQPETRRYVLWAPLMSGAPDPSGTSAIAIRKTISTPRTGAAATACGTTPASHSSFFDDISPSTR